MCGAELASLVTAMAVTIAQGRTEDEIQILSDIFTQLGDTLQTIVGQQARCGCQNTSGTLPVAHKKVEKGS